MDLESEVAEKKDEFLDSILIRNDKIVARIQYTKIVLFFLLVAFAFVFSMMHEDIETTKESINEDIKGIKDDDSNKYDLKKVKEIESWMQSISNKTNEEKVKEIENWMQSISHKTKEEKNKISEIKQQLQEKINSFNTISENLSNYNGKFKNKSIIDTRVLQNTIDIVNDIIKQLKDSAKSINDINTSNLFDMILKNNNALNLISELIEPESTCNSFLEMLNLIFQAQKTFESLKMTTDNRYYFCNWELDYSNNASNL